MKKYVIFIDESGDPNVVKIDSQYPVFGVGALIFEKTYFENTIIPNFESLKVVNGFEKDTIFHSSEIRKRRGVFKKLNHYEKRKHLLDDISRFFKENEVTIISSVIHKEKLKSLYQEPGCPYDLAFQFILERCEHFLRNKKAIAELFLERRDENVKPLQKVFDRLKEKGNGFSSKQMFIKVFPQKKLNFVGKENIGTQITDLAIYPITTKVIRPEKENRAFQILTTKFYSGNFGDTAKYGLKIFP